MKLIDRDRGHAPDRPGRARGRYDTVFLFGRRSRVETTTWSPGQSIEDIVTGRLHRRARWAGYLIMAPMMHGVAPGCCFSFFTFGSKVVISRRSRLERRCCCGPVRSRPRCSPSSATRLLRPLADELAVRPGSRPTCLCWSCSVSAVPCCVGCARAAAGPGSSEPLHHRQASAPSKLGPTVSPPGAKTASRGSPSGNVQGALDEELGARRQSGQTGRIDKVRDSPVRRRRRRALASGATLPVIDESAPRCLATCGESRMMVRPWYSPVVRTGSRPAGRLFFRKRSSRCSGADPAVLDALVVDLPDEGWFGQWVVGRGRAALA